LWTSLLTKLIAPFFFGGFFLRLSLCMREEAVSICQETPTLDVIPLPPCLFVCFTAIFLVAICEELLHLQRMESLVHLRDMEVENCIALILHQSTILVEAISAGQQLCNLLNIWRSFSGQTKDCRTNSWFFLQFLFFPTATAVFFFFFFSCLDLQMSPDLMRFLLL
jgi:hypothetical protein